MNKTQTIASGNSNMIRPCFGPGMLLQHEDLEQIIEYTTGMYRLLFRSLLGPGVVCGLEVIYDKDKKPNFVTIKSGVAMDCEGYVIEVPKDQTIAIDKCNKPTASGLIVLRRSKPKPSAIRHAVCSEGMDSSISSREVEGFEILVVEVEKAKLKEVVTKYSNPLNANECPSNCCIGNGVMLASFEVNDDKIEINRERRLLRIQFEKQESNDTDPKEQPKDGTSALT